MNDVKVSMDSRTEMAVLQAQAPDNFFEAMYPVGLSFKDAAYQDGQEHGQRVSVYLPIREARELHRILGEAIHGVEDSAWFKASQDG